MRRASVGNRRAKPQLPLYGFPAEGVPTPRLDELDNADLERLNGLLPWSWFTVDSRGRRFGDAAWVGKRDQPQRIPDRRAIVLGTSISPTSTSPSGLSRGACTQLGFASGRPA